MNYPIFRSTIIIRCCHFRGVGAMEIVAMDMKLRGMYIARQLSFHGVSFKVDDVPLTKEFIQMYDNSVKLVRFFFDFYKLFKFDKVYNISRF